MKLFCVADELLSCGAGIVLKFGEAWNPSFVKRSSFVNFVNIFFVVRDSGVCLSICKEKFFKESIQTYMEETVSKTSVSRQTIS